MFGSLNMIHLMIDMHFPIFCNFYNDEAMMSPNRVVILGLLMWNKVFIFIFDAPVEPSEYQQQYSGTPPNGHLVSTATSLLQLVFLSWQNDHTFLI